MGVWSSQEWGCQGRYVLRTINCENAKERKQSRRQGGCEPRIEVIVKMQKKENKTVGGWEGVRPGDVRLDMN